MSEQPIRRALLSVSDKTDLVPFARALADRGVEIVSTGGTANALQDAGIDVIPISDVTGFPEMMDGRVKTLHPSVHGAILAKRDDPSHVEAMRTHGITPIDLVCINLYPFERTVARSGVTLDEAIEQIDIGGPTLIRSAAKNARWVTVVTSPVQYDQVIAELEANDGATTRAFRGGLAASAFGRTSAYDLAIAKFLGNPSEDPFPPILRLDQAKAADLRYGENPHQAAALYRDPAATGANVVTAEQLHGKALSYNNLNDASAAFDLVVALRRLGPVGACVVKHTNPCGCATAPTARDAIEHALLGDPMAAYGGILAVNGTIDGASATRLCADDVFLEVIVAPAFDDDAVETLRQRWSQVRLLATGPLDDVMKREIEFRTITGGTLAQERDRRLSTPRNWEHHAGPEPKAPELQDGAFAETVVRALTSNSICLVKRFGDAVRLVGAGAGQMDRVASCRIAVEKAGAHASGSVAASDAFFPFDDGPTVLIDAGVRMLVHPGGSKRDQDTFDLCERRGVTCVTTGMRRFRH